jgi:hypothetical protein
VRRTPSRRRWVLRVVAMLATSLALLVGAALLFGGVSDRKALQRSLTREAVSPFEARCTGHGSGVLRCTVADRMGSGIARYRLVDSGDCWSARRTSPPAFTETPMPARLEGCRALRDTHPAFDLFFTAGELL